MQRPQYFSRPPEHFGGKIPFIVTDIIECLRAKDALKLEGILRKSGAASQIADLSLELDQGRIADWSKYENVHTIACTLKKYFRDLVDTDPIFPKNLYERVCNIPKNTNKEQMITEYKKLIGELPVARRLTLAFLFRFLYEITTIESNKMTSNNIAIVFAPNLLAYPEGISAEESLQYTALQNRTIATMIANTEEIFGDIEINEKSFITDEDMPIIADPPIRQSDIDKFTQLQEIRKKSVIQFVPYELLSDPNFVRPTRVVTFPDE